MIGHNRREVALRNRVQMLESRQRVALTALDAFQEWLIILARNLLSIGDLSELVGQLQSVRTLLGEEVKP
jgi:hypothetical protein